MTTGELIEHLQKCVFTAGFHTQSAPSAATSTAMNSSENSERVNEMAGVGELQQLQQEMELAAKLALTKIGGGKVSGTIIKDAGRVHGYQETRR